MRPLGRCKPRLLRKTDFTSRFINSHIVSGKAPRHRKLVSRVYYLLACHFGRG
jgi:hypothetical protein